MPTTALQRRLVLGLSLCAVLVALALSQWLPSSPFRAQTSGGGGFCCEDYGSVCHNSANKDTCFGSQEGYSYDTDMDICNATCGVDPTVKITYYYCQRAGGTPYCSQSEVAGATPYLYQSDCTEACTSTTSSAKASSASSASSSSSVTLYYCFRGNPAAPYCQASLVTGETPYADKTACDTACKPYRSSSSRSSSASYSSYSSYYSSYSSYSYSSRASSSSSYRSSSSSSSDEAGWGCCNLDTHTLYLPEDADPDESAAVGSRLTAQAGGQPFTVVYDDDQLDSCFDDPNTRAQDQPDGDWSQGDIYRFQSWCTNFQDSSAGSSTSAGDYVGDPLDSDPAEAAGAAASQSSEASYVYQCDKALGGGETCDEQVDLQKANQSYALFAASLWNQDDCKGLCSKIRQIVSCCVPQLGCYSTVVKSCDARAGLVAISYANGGTALCDELCPSF